MTAPAPAAFPARVLLTRAEDDCAAWAAELERRGHVAVSLPCIAAERLDTPALRKALVAAAARADWIVFTSRRGVEAFAELGKDAVPGDAQSAAEGRPFAAAQIAVVGAATAEAARRALGRVDLVGPGTADALAGSLAQRIAHERSAAPPDAPRPQVVAALAANARETFERTLSAAGIGCARFDVYRTVPAAPARPKRPYAALGVDAVLLASPSAVQGLGNQVALDAAARLVSIGPSTTAAVRALGLEVAAEATVPSLEGLLAALETAASA